MMPLNQTRIFDPLLLQTRCERASRLAPADSFGRRIVAERLCERLHDVARSFSSVLVLGPRSATLAKGLEAIPQLTWLEPFFDQDLLPFSDHSFDLVLSFLTLHQADHPRDALQQILRVLRPQGLFLGAMGGAGTLAELRESLTQAELALLGGAALHFSPLPTLAEMGNAVAEAGFTLPLVDHELMTVLYDHPQKLVQDLREMGEGNSLLQRQKQGMRPNVRNQAFRYYTQHFLTAEGKIKATFDVLFAHGWGQTAANA